MARIHWRLDARLVQVNDALQIYQMQREIAILRKVSYDRNIVQFYGACTSQPTMLCMEYMEVRKRLSSPRPAQQSALPVTTQPGSILSRNGVVMLVAPCYACCQLSRLARIHAVPRWQHVPTTRVAPVYWQHVPTPRVAPVYWRDPMPVATGHDALCT